jgi:hypothetical protein
MAIIVIYEAKIEDAIKQLYPVEVGKIKYNQKNSCSTIYYT